MKKFISILCAFSIFVAIGVQALADEPKNAKDVLFSYEETEDGNLKITDVSGDLGDTLTFPSEIDKKAVKEIKIYADSPSGKFELDGVKKLIFEDGIEEIGDFGGNAELESVELAKSVKKIDGGAFSWCENLKEINLENVEYIGKGAFSWCDSLESVDLTSLKEFDGAQSYEISYGSNTSPFGDCTNLKNVRIKYPETNSKALFVQCPNLERVEILKGSETPAMFEFCSIYSTGQMEATFGAFSDKLKIYSSDGGIKLYANTRNIPFEALNGEITGEASDWAAKEIGDAVYMGFVPMDLRGDYQKPMTRAEFAELAVDFFAEQYGYSSNYNLLTYELQMSNDERCKKGLRNFWDVYTYNWYDENDTSVRDYENRKLFNGADTWENLQHEEYMSPNGMAALPFDDVDRWTDKENYRSVIAANLIGLVQGKGERKFDPTGEITREEAAALLMRLYRAYGGEVSTGEVEYADKDAISDWARADVYSAALMGIMQGVGENTFNPKGNYTREQAVVTLKRLYENAPTSRKNGNIAPLMSFDETIDWIKDKKDRNVFYETERFESPYCTVLVGYENHAWLIENDRRIYLVYKNGGYKELIGALSPTETGNQNPVENVYLSDDGKFLHFTFTSPASFRNMNIAPNVTYEKGTYNFTADLEYGVISNVEAQ